MSEDKFFSSKNWINEKRRQRARRALERQLEYQQEKSSTMSKSEKDILLNLTIRSQAIRRRLSEIKPISNNDRILEVGSGAHGLIFGFGAGLKVGVDPLAVDYRQLFPAWQKNSYTTAAIGEQLPFADQFFDVVLSDNVIDHAEKPLKIVEELIRVLKPGGLLYFTVNVHHPIYEIGSKAHGLWNALGIRFELSPFADHTVHLSENVMKKFFARLPIKIIEQNSSTKQTKSDNRRQKSHNAEQFLKKIFYKNAVFEIIAVRD